MSGYFDALMRSSGITVDGAEPAPTKLEPAAIGADVDRSMTDTEANVVPPAMTPHEPFAPLHTSEAAKVPMPQVPTQIEQHTHEEPETAPARARGATEGAAQSPQKPSAALVESPMPDLGHALVRAAMRWVAAGTPQVSPDSAVGPVSTASNIAHDVPAQQSLSAALQQVSTIATKTRDDDEQLESSNRARATLEPLNVPARESVAEKPVPIRASLVTPAPVPPVAPSVRNEVVHVSIGAIHVRVDALPAQSVARPALTPAASTPGAAPSRPARSALSRRALRRI
jgi:hypothetical protein